MKFALNNAFNGLSTILKIKSNNTVPTPFGAAEISSFTDNATSVGNKNPAITATNAAKKVPTKYNTMMDFMLVLEPTFLLAIAAITKTKINNGATARNERTKI